MASGAQARVSTPSKGFGTLGAGQKRESNLRCKRYPSKWMEVGGRQCRVSSDKWIGTPSPLFMLGCDRPSGTPILLTGWKWVCAGKRIPAREEVVVLQALARVSMGCEVVSRPSCIRFKGLEVGVAGIGTAVSSVASLVSQANGMTSGSFEGGVRRQAVYPPHKGCDRAFCGRQAVYPLGIGSAGAQATTAFSHSKGPRDAESGLRKASGIQTQGMEVVRAQASGPSHLRDGPPQPGAMCGYQLGVDPPGKVDRKTAPTYEVEADPDNLDNSTCILRFIAGPPYEDIAFRIVRKEWEYSHKRGFKCTFERGILHLYFNFARPRYRR
eukprot:gene32164-16698_t